WGSSDLSGRKTALGRGTRCQPRNALGSDDLRPDQLLPSRCVGRIGTVEGRPHNGREGDCCQHFPAIVPPPPACAAHHVPPPSQKRTYGQAAVLVKTICLPLYYVLACAFSISKTRKAPRPFGLKPLASRCGPAHRIVRFFLVRKK